MNAFNSNVVLLLLVLLQASIPVLTARVKPVFPLNPFHQTRAIVQPAFLSSVTLVTSLMTTSLGRVKAMEGFGVDKSGLLRPCDGTCISSQDDRPEYFIPPLCYDGNFQFVRLKLLDFISRKMPNAQIVSGGADIDVNENVDKEVIEASQRYIRAIVKEDEIIDDVEFYFTPNDNTIQFRILRRGGKFDLLGENRKIIERIKQALNLDYVPVLRNRQRAVIFFESPLDTFGPPSTIFDQGDFQ